MVDTGEDYKDLKDLNYGGRRFTDGILHLKDHKNWVVRCKIMSLNHTQDNREVTKFGKSRDKFHYCHCYITHYYRIPIQFTYRIYEIPYPPSLTLIPLT